MMWKHDGLIAEMENILTVREHDQTWCHAAVNLRHFQAKSLKFIFKLRGDQQGGLQWENTSGKQNIYNIKIDGKTASANVNVGNVFPKMLATIQECIISS